MEKVELRGWYKMQASESAYVIYLTPAHSLPDAIRRFGILAQNAEVKAVTWAELVEIVGCVMPVQAHPLEQAVGPVTFKCKDKVVSFWGLA